MKAKDIILLACDFVGVPEIAEKIGAETQLSASETNTLNTLKKCLNLVQNQVACEYIPLEKIQEVQPKDFKVDYSTFDKKPIAVVWAKDKFGRNLRFKSFSDYLMVFSSYAKVKYYYFPQEITSLDDEMNEELLPMRIYAYGVAREYFLLQNLSDECDIWEIRFKDSLSSFARKKRDVKMPCRRWL